MRWVAGLVVAAALVAAGIFFADHPGRVAIEWRGWEIDTSVGVLAAAALMLALVAALLLRLGSAILRSPRAVARWRRERRRRSGYRALSQGMVAVAAGEPEEARRYGRRAGALLVDPPLALLLSAQAAQLDGDENAARKCFTAMLDRPEMEFLGLRGLLNQALREGDRGTALGLAERAHRLRPNTHWVTRSLFDLEIREGRWEAALGTLAQMTKQRLLTAEEARRHRGVIHYEMSREALDGGDRRNAAKLAAQAQGLTPELAAPAAHQAQLLLDDGQATAAAKAVERAWRTAPNPELARIYETIHREAPPLARMKRFERLAAQNPAARESHLALAEAALAAQLWGEARRRLERVLPTGSTEGPSARVCLLMARLEEAEHQDFARVRGWLDRAVAASPEPRYVCTNCGGDSLEWHSLCPRCAGFDTLVWRQPAVAPHLALSAATTPPTLEAPATNALAEWNAADGLANGPEPAKTRAAPR
jgi:HemY protein